MPRPSVSVSRSRSELDVDLVSSEIVDFDVLNYFSDFLWDYTGWIVGCLLGVGIVGYLVQRLHRRQKYIKKLWLFMLFFLTKRQMALPLIYTLSKRDGVLDEVSLGRILLILQQCRDISFRKSPVKRLALEQSVSKFLFEYFSVIEKAGKITDGSKFDRIVKDLEFIDSKLMQLQDRYNKEVVVWNGFVGIPVVKYVFLVVGLRALEKF